MDITKSLVHLESYYHKSRGIGHTETMLRGVQNVEKVAVLLPNHRMGDDLIKKRNPKADLLSWSDLEALREMNIPLMLDHTITELICKESMREIRRLKTIIYAIRELTHTIEET